MAKTALNNAEAYRFINLYMIPAMSKTFDKHGIKYVAPDKNSSSYDIIYKVRLGNRLTQTAPTVYYPGSNEIGISLHKMMLLKTIITIIDGSIYVISGEKLNSVWLNPSVAYVENRQYTDGLGERSQMTRIKIAWFKENAEYSFEMDEDVYNQYLEDITMLKK